MSSRSFGRRGEPLGQFSRSMAPIEAFTEGTRVATPDGSLGQPGPLLKKLEFSSLDDDLELWKLARKQNFEIPWRPLWVLGSLFFGIASFALSDSVNDIVEWSLYAVAAASLWVGFRRRRRQAKI